jgi:hypothetical protein
MLDWPQTKRRSSTFSATCRQVFPLGKGGFVDRRLLEGEEGGLGAEDEI